MKCDAVDNLRLALGPQRVRSGRVGRARLPTSPSLFHRSRLQPLILTATKISPTTHIMSSSASASVTPQRRRREDDADDIDSDVENATSTQAFKRQRLEDDEAASGSDDHADYHDGDGHDSVLPDSFLRSPKGKQRARTKAIRHEKLEHKPGTIVRVTMKNFVTYTWAEFQPGPGLNMIVGPNGTGKSTLVCAICLGLGSPPAHLGRAKEISEFVKHGSKEATIEIELKADPERHGSNPVVGCRIARDGGGKDSNNSKKTTFFINGQKSTNKAVLELVRSFSIQVDNLCQFLPQDRVVEFAALSPVDLLAQTQRAAAPEYMTEWHEQLKTMRKEQKQKLAEQQSGIDDLKRLEDRQKAQEGEVERMRERTAMQEKLAILKKFRPFAEYNELKENHIAAKARKENAIKEYRELERMIAPNLTSLKRKKEYLARVSQASVSQAKLVDRTKTVVADALAQYDASDGRVQDCDKESEAEKNGAKKAKADMSRHQNFIRDTKRHMQNRPESFDAVEINSQIRDLKTRRRTADQQALAYDTTIQDHAEKKRQRKHLIDEELKRKDHLQSQAGRLASKLDSASPDTGRAWKWVEENRDKFRGEVYGPPMIECSVQNSTHAGWVESMMGDGELKAITVTNADDFRMLSLQVYTNMKLTDVNIRSSNQTLANFRPTVSPDQLRRMGLDGWLMDLIEGPAPVLAMLCDNRSLHMTPYATKEISDSQLESIKQSAIGGWVTPEKMWRIMRRREYGDAGVQTRVESLRRARLLTDAPVNTQAEEEINERVKGYKREIEELEDEMKGLNEQYTKHRSEEKLLGEKIKSVEEDKKHKQEQLTQFEGLGAKLTAAENRYADAKKKVADQNKRLAEIHEQKQAFIFEKAQKAINHARYVDTLRKEYQSLLKAEIIRIEAQSDVDQLEERNSEQTRLLQERHAEVERLQTTERELKRAGREKHELCGRLGPEFDDLPSEHEELLEGIKLWQPPRLDTEIASAQASLEMLAGAGNANLIKEFEERGQRIARKKAAMHALETDLSQLTDKIRELQGEWEPRLDTLVDSISDAFADNFNRIQCAGEVGIDKHEDFDQWAIQIKVKFRQVIPQADVATSTDSVYRENEELSILDSHRQSGGERAVSTIFYLMALQSLARAPFRVVDEINQGMDPRNERSACAGFMVICAILTLMRRLVHSRMVDIACSECTSQYFLITPKLLNNLKYHPNMKVHCIASGEYMPGKDDPLDTFEALAQTALAIKASA